MKGLLLEEAYEVIDAANARDSDTLADELGDLLFQVVFYSRLAEEEGRFALDDVIERLHAKLLRRHPHVFGENRARTPEEALRSWLTVKEREGERELKSGTQLASLLDGIPKILPATLEAYELGVRAAEVGFDWANIEDLLDKIAEEAAELQPNLAVLPRDGTRPKEEARSQRSADTPQGLSSDHRYGKDNHSRIEEEVGDLLFAVANLARYLRSDPESCLRRANQKFKRRFQALEKEVAKIGKKVRECTAEELDTIWAAVKAQEPARP